MPLVQGIGAYPSASATFTSVKRLFAARTWAASESRSLSSAEALPAAINVKRARPLANATTFILFSFVRRRDAATESRCGDLLGERVPAADQRIARSISANLSTAGCWRLDR